MIAVPNSIAISVAKGLAGVSLSSTVLLFTGALISSGLMGAEFFPVSGRTLAIWSIPALQIPLLITGVRSETRAPIVSILAYAGCTCLTILLLLLPLALSE